MPHTLKGRFGKYCAAGITAIAFGVIGVLSGVGFARSGDGQKGLADKAAKVEGQKVDDKKAADKNTPGFDPKDVRVGPPPELAALRSAVEEAARKGENVEEIRKQLNALEKALTGKAWVKPKPVEEPPAPPAGPAPLPFPGVQPGLQFGLVQPDLNSLLKAQELLLKAAELAGEDPVKNREKVEAMRRAARDLMAKALGNGNFLMPEVPNFGLPGVAGQGRLGVRISRVPDDLAKEIDLPAGRGILVTDVVNGSVAERVGIKPDDVVVEFAGQPVADEPAAFVRTVMAAKSGTKVDIVVVRDKKKVTIKGVELAPIAPALRK